LRRTTEEPQRFVVIARMLNLPEFPPGWHCYLLFCSNASYYCGITSNLRRRIRDHSLGKGSGYTKASKAVALVWYESLKDRRHAAERERQIKAWNHDKKKRLAEGKSGFEGLGTPAWVPLA
jgi:putative endonuclease